MHTPPPPKFFHTTKDKYVFKMHIFVLFLMYSISAMVLPLRSLFSGQLNRILLAYTHTHFWVPHYFAKWSGQSTMKHQHTFYSYSLEPAEPISWLCQAEVTPHLAVLKCIWQGRQVTLPSGKACHVRVKRDGLYCVYHSFGNWISKGRKTCNDSVSKVPLV